MKSVLGPAIVAVAFALAGGALWIAGQTDRRIVEVHQRLATLQFAAASTESGDVEQALGLERRVPVLGPAAAADVRSVRATTGYWQADYAAIDAEKDANGVVTDTDPTILFLMANAAFRASQGGTSKVDAVRRLDTVVRTYGDVVKNNPAQADAAYNFEYAIRVREALAHPRPAAASKALAAKTPQRPAGDQIADLPAGPTLHGQPGAPPTIADMNQFKIVIPKRGEERNEAPDAGKGGTKVRKG
jgi:hypothetical protein